MELGGRMLIAAGAVCNVLAVLVAPDAGARTA
jgi:hypothetical protein